MKDAADQMLIELYRSARESPTPEFQERTIGLLNSVCRFDSVMWCTGEVVTDLGFVFHSVNLHNISPDMLVDYGAIADRDVVGVEAWKRPGQVCAFNTRDLMPRHRFPDIAAFDRKHSLINVLCGTAKDRATGSMDFLGLWRGKERDRYSEVDRRRGAALIPHVLEAGAINRQAWLNQLTASTIARRGIRAISSIEGILHTHDTDFIALIRKEWPDWSPPIIPTKLTEALERSTSRIFNGKRISVSASIESGLLFLLAREKRTLDGLTNQELVVARLIADGQTYKGAAKTLDVSAATVRNHIHAVYKKLGIPNKSTLARWMHNRSR